MPFQAASLAVTRIPTCNCQAEGVNSSFIRDTQPTEGDSRGTERSTRKTVHNEVQDMSPTCHLE